jgi:MFS transporter, PPP family, 3-phenylpropionic acid transporter
VPLPAPPPTPVTPLAAFGLLWFTYFVGIGLFNPYAPLWFKELGFSTLAIGALASLQSWTRVFVPYGWGWLGDHGGDRVRLLRWAAVAALLASLALTLDTRYGVIAVVVAGLFLANGGVVPLCEAALSQHLNTAQGLDAARYGRVRMWGSVGFVVAVTSFGLLLEWWPMRWFPWLVVAVYAILVLATLRLPPSPVTTHASEVRARVWPVLRQPVVAWFFASVFFTVLAHTGLYAFFSLYLDYQGYPKTAVGGLWAVAVVMEIGFFWFQGRFFGRFDPHRWLVLAAACTVLRFVMTAAFGAHLWWLVAAQTLHAITFAGHHAACITLVHRHFPGAMRGRGQALYSALGYGAAGVLGGIGGGWLIDHLGHAAVYWASACAGLMAWVCASRAGASALGNAQTGRQKSNSMA